MSIEVGDNVKFLNENLEGIVVTISDKNKITVEANDGFEYTVNKSELIKINDDNSINYNIDENTIQNKVNTPIKSSTNILTPYITNTKYQYERVVEIDLHLEELVEFPNKLENWQKLHTQLQHAKKCMSAAYNEKVKRIIFIHGKGTGVLKIELRNMLSNYDNIIVKDADYQEYCTGATEVIIK